MKNMVTLMLLLVMGCAVARPTKYDQRQDGDWNVHAHLENVVIVYVSKGSGLGVNLLELYNKKAAAKHHAQGKDADEGANVVIADSPGGVEVQFKATKEEEAVPEKSSGTTLPVETSTDEVTPYKESSTEKDSSSDESSSSSNSSSDEDSKEKSSEEEGSKNKSSEESSSKEKSSEEDSTSDKSAEESTTTGAPGKKSKEARLLDRTKLRQMLADGVEPCQRVSNDGLCQPVSGDVKRRMERQQRQRLIDILSAGISPAI